MSLQRIHNIYNMSKRTYWFENYIYNIDYKVVMKGQGSYCKETQCWESHITSWIEDVASKKQLMKVKAIEMATWSQNLSKGLQKFGRGVCLIPVRFRFVTPDEADPALINA